MPVFVYVHAFALSASSSVSRNNRKCIRKWYDPCNAYTLFSPVLSMYVSDVKTASDDVMYTRTRVHVRKSFSTLLDFSVFVNKGVSRDMFLFGAFAISPTETTIFFMKKIPTHWITVVPLSSFSYPQPPRSRTEISRHFRDCRFLNICSRFIF